MCVAKSFAQAIYAKTSTHVQQNVSNVNTYTREHTHKTSHEGAHTLTHEHTEVHLQ
jgi:hypothetical protein